MQPNISFSIGDDSDEISSYGFYVVKNKQDSIETAKAVSISRNSSQVSSHLFVLFFNALKVTGDICFSLFLFISVASL